MPRKHGTQFIWVNGKEDSVHADTLRSLGERLKYFDESARLFPSVQWYMLECLGEKRHGAVFALEADEARRVLVGRLKAVEAGLERNK